MNGRTIVERERGFTLLELMFVIMLIGVLAGIGLEYVSKAMDKARISADIDQGRRLKEAMDVFYVRNGRYPDSINELMSSGYIHRVVSAQKVGGQSVEVNDTTWSNGSDPVFNIDLTYGNVVVNDVSTGAAPVPVWSSSSG